MDPLEVSDDQTGRVRSSDRAELRRYIDLVEETCGDQMISVVAAYGDWTPWNMASTETGAVAWDWERFDIDVPMGWDALHYSFKSSVVNDGLSARQCGWS